MIERERPVRTGDGKSGLEQALMTILASLEAPEPVRELHFAWCCEHPKKLHSWYRGGPSGRAEEFHYCEGCFHAGYDFTAWRLAFHKYSHERDWRFDFAWPAQRIAVEVEGGTWQGGRHTRGRGYEDDCEKYNRAAELGWRVFRFTEGMLLDGRARETLERVLGGA